MRAVQLQNHLRNQLRSRLLTSIPAVLPLLAAEDLRDALGELSVAPSPAMGGRVSLSKLESTLRRHGRQRNVASRAQDIETLLRAGRHASRLPAGPHTL